MKNIDTLNQSNSILSYIEELRGLLKPQRNGLFDNLGHNPLIQDILHNLSRLQCYLDKTTLDSATSQSTSNPLQEVVTLKEVVKVKYNLVYCYANYRVQSTTGKYLKGKDLENVLFLLKNILLPLFGQQEILQQWIKCFQQHQACFIRYKNMQETQLPTHIINLLSAPRSQLDSIPITYRHINLVCTLLKGLPDEICKQITSLAPGTMFAVLQNLVLVSQYVSEQQFSSDMPDVLRHWLNPPVFSVLQYLFKDGYIYPAPHAESFYQDITRAITTNSITILCPYRGKTEVKTLANIFTGLDLKISQSGTCEAISGKMIAALCGDQFDDATMIDISKQLKPLLEQWYGQSGLGSVLSLLIQQLMPSRTGWPFFAADNDITRTVLLSLVSMRDGVVLEITECASLARAISNNAHAIVIKPTEPNKSFIEASMTYRVPILGIVPESTAGDKMLLPLGWIDNYDITVHNNHTVVTAASPVKKFIYNRSVLTGTTNRVLRRLVLGENTVPAVTNDTNVLTLTKLTEACCCNDSQPLNKSASLDTSKPPLDKNKLSLLESGLTLFSQNGLSAQQATQSTSHANPLPLSLVA